MTIINPKSIAGVTSITTPSGSDNLFTVHTNNTTERIRINNDGDVIVGSGITVSPDGDIFATGVCTATSFVGSGANLTGVASTENIRTNTNATFLQNVTVVGTSTVTGNIVPSSDSATDIGTNSVRFQNAYVDTYYGDGSNLTGIDLSAVTGATGDFSIADKIVHTGDTNTAIRFPSADNISFEVAGTERLRIDDSDGVIAKHTTAANLRIQNSTAASSQTATLDMAPANGLSGVQLKCTSEEDFSTGANRTAFFTLENRKDGTFYERLRIDSNGKFCFGTYNSGYANNDSVANFVNAASAGTENPLITLWNPTTAGDSRASIDFLTNDNSGTGRDGAFIRASNDGSTAKANLIFGTIKDETYAETVRITSDGKIGINDDNPSRRLEITEASDTGYTINTATVNNVLVLTNPQTGSTKNVGLSFSGGYSNGEGYITMVGDGGSGGDFRFALRSGGSRSDRMTITNDSTINGDFNDTSDINLKENIASISSSIDKVKQLRPVTFDWKESYRPNNVSGFIAQEVKTIYPDLVRGAEWTAEDPGKHYTINTMGMVAHLTKALQESITKIEVLETRLNNAGIAT